MTTTLTTTTTTTTVTTTTTTTNYKLRQATTTTTTTTTAATPLIETIRLYLIKGGARIESRNCAGAPAEISSGVPTLKLRVLIGLGKCSGQLSRWKKVFFFASGSQSRYEVVCQRWKTRNFEPLEKQCCKPITKRLLYEVGTPPTAR